MLLGYNTNGFAHHRLEDALDILAELGYQSVAITLDYHALDSFSLQLPEEIRRIRKRLRANKLHSVIETGARFLLDPRRKHQPTLISPSADERQRRLDFLMRAIDIAVELESHAVSFWSGSAVDAGDYATHFQHLRESCQKLCDYADKKQMRLAFEPEPGMLIDTMSRFAELQRALSHPYFGLTIDIGHLHCQGETPIADYLHTWQDLLWNIHIEDMRQGIHDHLMFGEGEIDFVPVLRMLQKIDYQGGVHVELSRHSHDAVETARKAHAFLEARMLQAG